MASSADAAVVPAAATRGASASADEAALDAMVEVAQICHFCAVFRGPLKLPVFGRSELQAAVCAGTNGHERQLALLAELHFKLVREHPNVKLERMVQDWERIVVRKVSEHWPLMFSTNPFETASEYDQLSVEQRIHVLNALCHWKLESCPEIHAHISTKQKEDEAKALEEVRVLPLGVDDAGSTYWYFGDDCWVYAEDLPKTVRHKASYAVEFADAKRIRLSINFDMSSSTKQVVESLDSTVHVESNSKMDIRLLVEEPYEAADEEGVSACIKSENVDVKAESEPVVVKEQTVDVAPISIKHERGKMDINMLCESPASSSDGKEAAMKGGDTTTSTEKLKQGDVSPEQAMKAEPPLVVEAQTSSDCIANNHPNGYEHPQRSVRKRPSEIALKIETRNHALDDMVISATESKKRVIVDDDNSSDDCSDGILEPPSLRKAEDSPTKKKPRICEPIPVERNESIENSANDSSSVPEKPATKIEDGKVPGTEPVVDDSEVTCETCKRSYVMRHLDPPLFERPVGEWRCFECLVNDARGWPRRRKPAKVVKSDPETEHKEPAKDKSSRKKTTSKTSKSRRRSSNSGAAHQTSSRSRGKSHRTHTSSKSSKKTISSKKKKRSKSSSSRHHSRHHHQRHHEEYASLLSLFRDRQRVYHSLRNPRYDDVIMSSMNVEGPCSWRVVCSTIDGLNELAMKLVGGSLEQDRLRGRLIVIQKTQEKLEVERQKKQKMVWEALPQRQSSRIAMGRIRDQTYSGDSGDDAEEPNHQRTRRQTRATVDNGMVGYDSKQRLALERESRARRRHQSTPYDEDSEEDAPKKSQSTGGWIDWSSVLDDKPLARVCSAIVQHLLQEEISELFSRPVYPEEDGCPDYLDVIKNPMDLGTIRERADKGHYETWDDFTSDVALVWENCRSYNGADTIIVEYANTLDKLFKSMRKTAERKGVKQWSDATKVAEKDIQGDDNADLSSSEPSDTESRGSITKEWSQSESSASDNSSDDSDEGMSSDSKNRTTRQTRRHAKIETPSTPVKRSRRRKRPGDVASDVSMSGDESMNDNELPPRSQPRTASKTSPSKGTAQRTSRRPPISESSSSSEPEASSDDDSSSSEDDAGETTPIAPRPRRSRRPSPEDPPVPLPPSPQPPPPPPPLSPGPDHSTPKSAMSSSSYFSSDSESSASEDSSDSD